MRTCLTLYTATLLVLALLGPVQAAEQSAAPVAGAVKAELVDINSATAAQLKALPGADCAFDQWQTAGSKPKKCGDQRSFPWSARVELQPSKACCGRQAGEPTSFFTHNLLT